MTKRLILNIKTTLLILILLLITFSYHPFFMNDRGNSLSMPILIITAFLTIVSFDYSLSASSFIRIYVTTFLLMINIVILFYGIGWSIEFQALREIFIPLCILIIGYNTIVTDDALLKILLVYALSLLLSSFFQIQQNIGGFIIAEQYLTEGKNALGPMLGAVCVLFVLLTVRNKNKRLIVLYLLLAFICFLFIVTIRARLAIVSTGLTLLFIFYLYYRSYNDRNRLVLTLLIISTILFLIYSLSGSLLPDSIASYLYNSFMLNKESDIFSDRGTRNENAIQIIKESPFWGNLVLNNEVKMVHNYPLLKISEYGLIGSIPWMFLYIFILIKSILMSLRLDIFQIRNYGIVLIFIPFLVSMGEPSFPFGPGTANFLVYFLFGISLKYNKKLKRINH